MTILTIAEFRNYVPGTLHCSVGYQKEAFETIFGRPVQASLKESKLTGAKRCVMEVRLS